MDLDAQHAKPTLVHKMVLHPVQLTFVEQMILFYQMEHAKIVELDSNQMVATELVLRTMLLHHHQHSIVMKDRLSVLMV
jgi:hypothetical protein